MMDEHLLTQKVLSPPGGNSVLDLIKLDKGRAGLGADNCLGTNKQDPISFKMSKQKMFCLPIINTNT